MPPISPTAVSPASRPSPARPAAPPRSSPAAAQSARRSAAPAQPLSEGAPAVRLQPARSLPKTENLPEPVQEVIRAPGSGSPLDSAVRVALEASLQVPLYPVRVHTDRRGATAVESLGARAFTYGTHVFLGSRERPTDLALMAHEVAHVVQQRGEPVLQMSARPDPNDRFEREAEQTSEAVRKGQRTTVKERAADKGVQTIWPVDEVADWLQERAWSLLREHAPELVPVIRKGPFEWLKEKITGAVETVFSTLMGPVRAITGFAAALQGHFGNLLDWAREAAARIARGDCGPISEAAAKIQQIFENLTAPVIDRIKQLAGRVKDFFTGLWDRFGAPVWQFLQRIGGQAWEKIQQLGRWIWQKTAPIRRILNRAWTWIKNRLGIGEGPEGQDGILQWVQGKARQVWDGHLKPFLERHKRPLLIVAGVLVMLSPAGPIIAIGAAIGGMAVGIRWIRQFVRNRQAIVQQRGYLQGVIIPGILNAVNRVSTFLMEKAGFIAHKLGQVISGLNEAIGTVAGTILNFVVSLLRWIVNRFQELVRWATGILISVVHWITSVLNRLRVFLAPVLNFLQRVAAAVANVMRLGYELGGRIWNAIPACLRDPFIDFFIPLILRQISFFRELASSPEAWRQTRGQIMELVRRIFRDFDVMGAIRTAFRIVVRALRIPVQLALQVLEKAAQAFDLVIAAPLRFIENALKALLVGIGRFMRNFLSHLWYGVQGWLLNAVEQSGTGIRPPASWDFRGIFGFVLDVLGISVDHILDLLARRVGRPVVDRIRRALNFLTGAWEWVRVAIEEGPPGIWRMVVDRLGNLARSVLEAAVGWVMTRIIAIVSARLTALAASAGLSGILEAVVAVYQAIQTALEYARRILEILLLVFNTVAQIARGVIDPAAEMVERGFRMAMPVVIGFLANYAGLGGIGGRIREIILDVRARVDNALLWLIDRALAAGRWLLDRLRAGVAAVMGWLRERREFRSPSGHPHTLFFSGSGRAARLMLASNHPATVEQRIEAAKAKPNADLAKLNQALERVAQIRAAIDRAMQESERNNEPGRLAAEATINQKLDHLKEILEQCQIDSSETPLTNLTYQVASGKASLVRAEPLTQFPGNTQGQSADAAAPADAPLGWSLVTEINSRSVIFGTLDNGEREPLTTSTGRIRLSKPYKKVHLISHHFHGPARRWNFIPAPQAVNSTFLADVENPIKQALSDETRIMSLQVRVSYASDPGDHVFTDAESGTEIARARKSDFPATVDVRVGEKAAEANTYSYRSVPTPPLEPPSVEGVSAAFFVELYKQRITRELTSATAPVPTWGNYYPNRIRSSIRRRIGPGALQELGAHYEQERQKRLQALGGGAS